MDWIHTFTIIGVLGAFVMYVSGRTDKRIDALENKVESARKELNDKIDFKIDASNKSLSDKIESTKKELKTEIREQDKKIDSLQKDINQIALNVSNIEGQITQMTRPNIIPMPRHQVNDEPKEN